MDTVTLLMLEFYYTASEGPLSCYVGKRFDGAIVTSFSPTFDPYEIRWSAPSPSPLMSAVDPTSPDISSFVPRYLTPPGSPSPPLQDWCPAAPEFSPWAPYAPVAGPSAEIDIKSAPGYQTVTPPAEPVLLPRGFDAGHSCNPIFFPESPVFCRPSEDALRLEFGIRLFDPKERNYDVKRPFLRYTPPADPPAMAEMVDLFEVDHWALHPLWSDPEQERWRAEWTTTLNDPCARHMDVDDACQLDCSDYWPLANERCVSAPAKLKGYDYHGENNVNMTFDDSVWGSYASAAATAQWTLDTAAASMSDREWMAPLPPAVTQSPPEICYASI